MKNCTKNIKLAALLIAATILPLVSQAQNVKPYDGTEILNKIADMFAHPKDGVDEYNLFVNDPRALAWDKKFFGNCAPAYPLHVDADDNRNPGGDMVALTIRYTINLKDTSASTTVIDATKQDFNNRITTSTFSLNNFVNDNKGICPAADSQYMKTVQEVLVAIAKSAADFAKLNQQGQAAKVASDKAASDAQNAANYAKMKPQIDADNAAYAKSQAAYAKQYACEASNPFKVFHYASEITRLNTYIDRQQAIIQQQKDGAAVSGMVDKQVMYDAGQRIAQAKAAIDDDFKAYKQFGGTAWLKGSIGNVPNPCAGL